jgi:hypothetical protein
MVLVNWGNAQDLPAETSDRTTLALPNGESATFQVDRPVNWTRTVDTSFHSVELSTLTVPINDTGLSIDNISVSAERMFDSQGGLVGTDFNLDVKGKNIVAAELTNPAGRKVAMSYDNEDEHFDIDLYDSGLTADQLVQLGFVSGTYHLDFHGPLGGTISTSVDVNIDYPTQVPNQIFPQANGIVNVSGGTTTFSWSPVTDPEIDSIRLDLAELTGDWQWQSGIDPATISLQVVGLPTDSRIASYLDFGNIQEGLTAQGIPFMIIMGNTQTLVFQTTSGIPGDMNGDGAFNSLDIPDFKMALSDKAAWELATNRKADLLADFNDDGVFNALDIPGFKTALAGGSAASVPEPATLTLVAALGLIFSGRKRKRGN